jgi:putative transposase
VALVIDAYRRAVVGWRVARTLRAELALDALEMAIWARQAAGLDELVQHSDRGVQYLECPLHPAAGRRGCGGLGRLTR